MKLDISYAEFSLLRDLVSAKQMDIWREKFLPRLKHGANTANAFKMMMSKKTTLTDRGCCALLLHRFQKAEEEVRKAIYAGKKPKISVVTED